MTFSKFWTLQQILSEGLLSKIAVLKIMQKSQENIPGGDGLY